MRRAGHRILPPVYLLATVAASVALHFALPLAVLVPAPLHLAGGVLVAAGLGITLWAAGLFRAAATPVVPFTQSTALVTGGIYQWTRNPMYLGMVVALLGLAVLLGTLGAFIPIPFFVWQIRRKFVLPEEAFLEGLFGGGYLEYKARVRRWL
jgi:protein-S-isoprenylcysteine O-methyltransferase Ste14